MKVAIVGSGFVGAACAKSMLFRRSCTEIVLLDIDFARARGTANDLLHLSVPLYPRPLVSAGSYEDVKGADVVIITAGRNERAGGATDRTDARGRLRLLPHNARVYEDIIPKIAEVAPHAPILVVTDPPDALADVARLYTDSNPILSAGTFLDTLRFKAQIGARLNCSPSSVEAMIIGEHGTSGVFVWSLARVGGVPVLELVEDGPSADSADTFRAEVEQAVRFANLEIIDGTLASQHGIGLATAWITEAMLWDQGLVAPVGDHHQEYGVTLSLPSVIDRGGVSRVLMPDLSSDEASALAASAGAIQAALDEVVGPLEGNVELFPPKKGSETHSSPSLKQGESVRRPTDAQHSEGDLR